MKKQRDFYQKLGMEVPGDVKAELCGAKAHLGFHHNGSVPFAQTPVNQPVPSLSSSLPPASSQNTETLCPGTGFCSSTFVTTYVSLYLQLLKSLDYNFFFIQAANEITELSGQWDPNYQQILQPQLIARAPYGMLKWHFVFKFLISVQFF